MVFSRKRYYAGGKQVMASSTPQIPLEADEQKVLVEWLTLAGILFYHIPNGGYRTPREAKKLKEQGVQSGVPDICIPVPNKFYAALYIELKRQVGGRISKNQEKWIGLLEKHGNCVVVAKGSDEAIEVIKHYFKFPKG